MTPIRAKRGRDTTRERLLVAVTPGWGGCILRTEGLDRDGYSLIRESGGKTRRAHRVAYELLIGQIPQGLHLDHLCHTRDTACPGGPACFHRRCINPAHLEPVTLGENTVRGGNSRKTQCKNGHEFTPANTWMNRGKRACRACSRDATARYRLRQTGRDAA